MTERNLTEREAFVARRYFIEQFNEREKSDVLAVWVNWMDVGDWQNEPLTDQRPSPVARLAEMR